MWWTQNYRIPIEFVCNLFFGTFLSIPSSSSYLSDTHNQPYKYTQTPRFAQAQNSVNTREFWTTSNNGKDFMFNYVATVLTRTCCFYISYNQNMSLLHITINHTVISVSYMDSKKISKSPAPWNNLTIQSLGFLMGFKKISKSPGPMEQLSIQSLGLLIGFQEDISISISSSISISVKVS